MSGCPKYFSVVVEASECLASLYRFYFIFILTPGVPGGPKHFSEVVEASECLASL